MCSELVAFNLRGNNEYLYTYRAEEKMVHGERPVYSREGEAEGNNSLTKKLERVGERKPRKFFIWVLIILRHAVLQKIYLAYEGGIWTEYGNGERREERPRPKKRT